MQDKQMQFMFMSEGGEVDPVSGNTIPPGGTAEGVRDDIDAKLSEGEYVIPANVVRFLGVDKLEKMVTKAEEQLAEMETKGRRGPSEEEDDLPFDDSELETVDETPLKMAVGGYVRGQSPGGFESKQYINAEGQKRLILFYNGVPINGSIPAGFFPDTPESRESLQVRDQTTVTPVSTVGEPRGDDKMPEKESEPIDVTKWTTDDFEQMLAQQKTTDLLSRGFGLGGPAGALIGMAMRKGNQMTLDRAALEITERLKNPEIPQEDKDRLTRVYQQMEKDKEKGGKGILGRVTSIAEDGLLGGLLGGDGLLGGVFKSARGKPQTSKTGIPRITPIPKTASESKKSESSQKSNGGADHSSGHSFKSGGLVKRKK